MMKNSGSKLKHSLFWQTLDFMTKLVLELGLPRGWLVCSKTDESDRDKTIRIPFRALHTYYVMKTTAARDINSSHPCPLITKQIETD